MGSMGEARGYHHGKLRDALVEASLAILGEGGAEQLTMREAARRVGVSPAAPFRHFPNRAALMAAIAQEALKRLCLEIEQALGASANEDPLHRYQAIGLAYLRWAFANPTLFEVISTRDLFDLDEAEDLRSQNQRLIALTEQTLKDAADRALVERAEIPRILIAGRALVYGLARMQLDGQFSRWGVKGGSVAASAIEALELFISGLKKPRRHEGA
jgi:AcrR family transcriptional regulator